MQEVADIDASPTDSSSKPVAALTAFRISSKRHKGSKKLKWGPLSRRSEQVPVPSVDPVFVGAGSVIFFVRGFCAVFRFRFMDS